MRKVTTLIAIYDLWCLLAISSLISVFIKASSLWVQGLNYLVIFVITYFWLGRFLTHYKTKNRYYRLSYDLKTGVLILAVVLFVIGGVRYLM